MCIRDRPISPEQIGDLIDSIETELRNASKSEIGSKEDVYKRQDYGQGSVRTATGLSIAVLTRPTKGGA